MASQVEIVITNTLDIFVITETWFKQEKEHTLCMLRDLLPGNKLTSLPQTSLFSSLKRKLNCSSQILSIPLQLTLYLFQLEFVRQN